MPRFKNFFGLLKLPSPKELGWSEHNALGCRDLTPFQEGKTWEDWDEYVKGKYPVRYWLVEELPKYFWPVRRKVKDAWYWVKCHTLPSHRWHKLDLRGVDPLSNYTHGYVDPCEVMKLAAWAALRSYVEKELDHERYLYEGDAGYTDEELGEEWYKEQKRCRYDEPMALYKYWMEGRAAEQKEEARLFELTKINKKNALEALNKEEYEAASKEWLDYHRACEAREQEMFLRLCAIREYLWT